MDLSTPSESGNRFFQRFFLATTHAGHAKLPYVANVFTPGVPVDLNRHGIVGILDTGRQVSIARLCGCLKARPEEQGSEIRFQSVLMALTGFISAALMR
ncbi:hypothetical protein [Spirosoma sordidisoli]|uniref:Uncharacterized protein n=1 Tax=Spirosoma sordidisoli TaxID=2502893 RepID=A0A4V1RW37_9BACT|nr:hypothetical protein [Spirosoma sordidisoli]RYC68908.1 hypothetical protein EQG79_16000 [Spirosoma sordidisoli]